MNFRSTFSQIVCLQVLAIAATSLVMPVAIYVFLDRTVSAYQVQMLRQRERVLFHALGPAPGGGLSLPESLQAPYAQEISGFAFSVTEAGRARPWRPRRTARPCPPHPSR